MSGTIVMSTLRTDGLEVPELPAECRLGLESSLPVNFARALNSAAKIWKKSNSPKSMIFEALEVIARATGISESEQNRRAAQVMETIPVSVLDDDSFVIRLGTLPMYVRAGIVRSIPKNRQSLIYGRVGSKAASDDNIGSTEEIRPLPLLNGQLDATENTANYQSREGVVVILASRITPEVQANLSLLEKDSFPVYRVTCDEDLRVYLDKPDVCGFVIDGSFWEERSAGEQIDVLKRIAAYSSMACIFVDDTNFSAPEKIRDAIDKQRLMQATHHEVQVRRDSRLSESDLPCFRRSASRLASSARPTLFLKDFKEHELVAIVAAAKAFFQDVLKRTEPLTSLGFATIFGGRSQAKVIRLFLHGLELPLVVKVNSKELICDEVERYRDLRGISRWRR